MSVDASKTGWIAKGLIGSVILIFFFGVLIGSLEYGSRRRASELKASQLRMTNDLLNRAHLKLQQDDFKGGMEDLERAERLMPDHPVWRDLKARADFAPMIKQLRAQGVKVPEAWANEPLKVPAGVPQGAPPLTKGAAADFVITGTTRWKIVKAVNRGQALKSDNEFVEAKMGNGTKFIMVVAEVENLDKGPKQTFATGVRLIDSQGREFEKLDDGDFFVPNALRSSVLNNFNPGIRRTFAMVFEVPADASVARIKLGDLGILFGEEKIIELPESPTRK